MSDTAVNMSVETLKRVDLVTVSGRIDSSNAAEFEGNIKELMNSGRHNLVLNLAGVTVHEQRWSAHPGVYSERVQTAQWRCAPGVSVRASI